MEKSHQERLPPAWGCDNERSPGGITTCLPLGASEPCESFMRWAEGALVDPLREFEPHQRNRHIEESRVLRVQEWGPVLRKQLQSEAWDVFRVNQVNPNPSSSAASRSLRASYRIQRGVSQVSNSRSSETFRLEQKNCACVCVCV